MSANENPIAMKELQQPKVQLLALDCGVMMPEAVIQVHQSGTGRCICGCVPPILSMFEMAALRAEKKKLQILDKNG